MNKSKAKKTYTVIGVYTDNHQRYATSVEASDPDEAEKEAQTVCREDNKMIDVDSDPLIIAAVVEGKVKIVA